MVNIHLNSNFHFYDKHSLKFDFYLFDVNLIGIQTYKILRVILQ